MKKGIDKIGSKVNLGAVFSYVKTVKKVKRVQKVEGGSKIEAVSAGTKNGNTAAVKINGKSILTNLQMGINVVVLEGSNHEVLF